MPRFEFTWILLSCFAFGTCIPSVRSEDSVEAKFILDSFMAGRDAIKSGHFIVKVAVSGDTTFNATFAGEYEVRFDYPKHLYRVDRVLSPDIPGWRRQAVFTPKFVLAHREGTGTLIQHQPSHKFDPFEHPVIDARLAGLETGEYLGYSTFDDFRNYLQLSAGSPSLFSREGEKIVIQFSNDSDQGSSTRRMTIDEKNGFTCSGSFVTTTFTNGLPAIHSEAKASYSSLSNAFVPTYCSAQRTTGQRIGATELQFNWKSVNEPIDAAIFSIDGMDQPGGTLVLDDRLGSGKPIIVRTIERDGKDDLPGGSTEIHSETTPRRSWWYPVNVMLFVCLLLVAIYKIYRRKV